ncbi:MAG TPA: ATP-grasp domain-containing protein, partial [Pirellulales bacterium]
GSELPAWYPQIAELTPRSLWFDTPPSAEVVSESIGWPVFVKGTRQTGRHDPRKCVARDAAEYERLVEEYGRDEILGWQRCVVREFVPLRPVIGKAAGKVRPSFEFRTFWWTGRLVGAGPYWSRFAAYSWTESERDAALKIAELAATRIDCPFLVVDLAQTLDGRWIVIECNDGQESGYAGVSPFALWHEIVRLSQA